MIVSTTWLADYVELPASVDELAERLALAGLNHESTRNVAGDFALELEVTSNRADCLGHIGVAREVAALFGRPLRVPDPRPTENGEPAAARLAVDIAALELCPFYSARVIRGVRVGPSPEWLVRRLATAGVGSVNNVVDVTNFVMLECGQPLHAFDLGRIGGSRIRVRDAMAGERFTALNHRTYELPAGTCVIADDMRAIALAGVMGGADTEIEASTREVLLESAQFAPLAVRAAARGLALQSGSSFRFERVPDPAAVAWASLRAAGLILEVAGGTLDQGVVSAGSLVQPQVVVPLGEGRVAAVLGVPVSPDRQRAILTALGFIECERPPADSAGRTGWRVPSWRRDVTREIDLVEEIARIEGYERVPEDVPIAARPVEWSARERIVRQAGEPLLAAGFCEAMTRSVVDARLESWPSPWGESVPLAVAPPLVRGADRLRRTLLPSLLEARAANAAVAAPHGDLFEIAPGYLARPSVGEPIGPGPVDEPLLLGFTVAGDFLRAKGLAEAVLDRLGVGEAARPSGPGNKLAEGFAGGFAEGLGEVIYRPAASPFFAAGRSAEVVLARGGRPQLRVGVVGEVAGEVLESFSLSGPVAAAELRLDSLEFAADRPTLLVRPSEFPPVERDLNLVVDEPVPWGEVAAAIRAAAAGLLERLRLVEVWRDTDRLGDGRKSFVVSLVLRSPAATLSGDDATQLLDAVVAECGRRVGAVLRG